jgi:glycosyltransferase involved in cell wall biosynthesis
MENVVANLLRNAPSHFQSRAWCLEELDELGRELAGEGFEVGVLGRQRRRDLRLFRRIAVLLRSQRIDLLHCHDELAWFYGTLAARIARYPTKVVMTMHGRRRNISARHLWEQRTLAALTSGIVSVSAFLRHQLLEELHLPPHRVATIANGIPLRVERPTDLERIDARGQLGLTADDFVIGSVGELSGVKNLELTLRAAVLIRESLPNVKVVFIGEGNERDRLAATVHDLDLGRHVLFAGLRRNVASLLPGFDIYVCSSDYEGVSLSILEAMARGCPVIATRVGGNPEVVCSGRTGILVPPRDVDALADAVLALAHDAVTRFEMGVHAQTIVRDRFSLGRMVDEYVDLYQSLLTPSLTQNGTDVGTRSAARTCEAGRENSA